MRLYLVADRNPRSDFNTVHTAVSGIICNCRGHFQTTVAFMLVNTIFIALYDTHYYVHLNYILRDKFKNYSLLRLKLN